MKKISSQPVIKRLKKQFSKKYDVTTESENKFGLDEAYYAPDLVFHDKKSGRIKVIVEVEQGTRKHVVGGVISADYCMGRLKQKPIMTVLALNEQDRKDYLKRLKMLNSYMRHISELFIGNEKDIVKKLKGI